MLPVDPATRRAPGGSPGRTGPGEIRALTGLRGVAAAIVVVYHATNEFTSDHPGPVGPGYLAVDLFFVLSGFVLALTYGGNASRRRPAGWFRTFAWHRFARIYPLYASLTLVWFVLASLDGPVPVASLASNLLLLQQTGIGLLSPDLGRSLIDPAWSIGAEAVAYLLFPALAAVALRSPRGIAAAGAGCCLAVLCWAAWAQPGLWGRLDLHDPLGFGALYRCLTEFWLGLLSFRLWSRSAPARVAAWRLEGPVWGLLLLFWFCRFDLLVVTLLPAVILACCEPGSFTARILAARPLHGLGEVSYALYLVHPLATLREVALAQALAARGVPFAASLAVVLACVLSVAAAWLLFRCIEGPARDWLRMQPALNQPAVRPSEP